LMADIAKENNIEHLVYSSVANADKNTGIPHFESKYKVEQHIKNLEIPHTIIGPTFFMENFLGPGLENGQLTLPLSSSSVIQQSALQNIAEFSAMVLERRKPFLGRRIDIASDEMTGEQSAEILSNVLGYKIKYVPVPLEQVYRANEDMARMYEWYEKVGTGIDISALHQEYPEVNWLTFKDWARSKLK
jgi:uncharacterized protein YbjT (DUF2867 family)